MLEFENDLRTVHALQLKGPVSPVTYSIQHNVTEMFLPDSLLWHQQLSNKWNSDIATGTKAKSMTSTLHTIQFEFHYVVCCSIIVHPP